MIRQLKMILCALSILLTINSNIVLAADIKTQYLPQGTAAPFSGYLFTSADAAAAAQDKQALPLYKQINESLQTSLTNETKKTEDEQNKNSILQSDLTAQQKANHDEKVASGWEKTGYFALGVITAYFTLRLASQVNTH